MNGVVVRTYSGFCYVDINGEIWECRLRGKFRLTKQSVLAGDKVVVKETGKRQGVIEDVLPRATKLDRPPVANVDQVLVVFACADPDPQTELLDRILIQAETAGITPVICFNKIDLVDGDTVESLTSEYRKAGYGVITTSTLIGTGIEDLREELKGKITVLAGPSGAGKSSLLNTCYPGFKLKTGKVSDKIGRGRHTTRYAELLETEPGSMVVDSPGFSSLHMPEIDKQHLAEMFPEFIDYLDQCKFNGCLHRAEPECIVKKAVEEGVIGRSRYHHYLLFLEELTARERRY